MNSSKIIAQITSSPNKITFELKKTKTKKDFLNLQTGENKQVDKRKWLPFSAADNAHVFTKTGQKII